MFLSKCYLRSHQIHIVYGIPKEDRPRIAAEIVLTLTLVVFQQNMLAQDVSRSPETTRQLKATERRDDENRRPGRDMASTARAPRSDKAKKARSFLVDQPVVTGTSVNGCYPQAWNAMGGANVMAASVLCSKVRQASDVTLVINCYSSAWQVNGGNTMAAATLCASAIN